MNSKIFSHIKKVIIVLSIIILCGTNAAYAATGSAAVGKSSFTFNLTDMFKNISKYFNFNTDEITLEELQEYLQNGNFTDMTDYNEILGKIEDMTEGEDKDTLTAIMNMFSGYFQMEDINIKELLSKLVDTLLNAIKSLIGDIDLDLGSLIGDIDLSSVLGNLNIGSLFGGSLEADVTETITMDAKTAVEFAGEDAAAQLSATLYMHQEETTKWALLIHPFMLSGSSIAGSVGPYYYEKGYNVIAPDLRGFGDSEGSVALGCFESMDIYDWLVKLNDEYDVTQVIVHGISLGGATTNYLSGIDGFINNGPTKINSTIKPIRKLKVVGLVEDCGYVDMTEFASESIVKSFSGIEDNFDYYSKATNSLQYCDVPMLVIHGTSDSMVDPENAQTVADTVNNNNYNGTAEIWSVDGGAHAFIIMGSNADEYKAHVEDFIDEYGNDYLEAEYETPTLTTDEKEEEEVEEEENSNSNILDLIKNFDFFKNIINFGR